MTSRERQRLLRRAPLDSLPRATVPLPGVLAEMRPGECWLLRAHDTDAGGGVYLRRGDRQIYALWADMAEALGSGLVVARHGTRAPDWSAALRGECPYEDSNWSAWEVAGG